MEKSNHDDDINYKKENIFEYADIKKAVEDVKHDFSNGDYSDKAKSTGKIIDKVLFNVGLAAGSIAISAEKMLLIF